MNVLLKIGSTVWMAKYATTAAKVVDALNAMTPLELDHGHQTMSVYFPEKDWGHNLEVSVPGKRHKIVKSQAEAIKLRKDEET